MHPTSTDRIVEKAISLTNEGRLSWDHGMVSDVDQYLVSQVGIFCLILRLSHWNRNFLYIIPGELRVGIIAQTWPELGQLLEKANHRSTDSALLDFFKYPVSAELYTRLESAIEAWESRQDFALSSHEQVVSITLAQLNRL